MSEDGGRFVNEVLVNEHEEGSSTHHDPGVVVVLMEFNYGGDAG